MLHHFELQLADSAEQHIAADFGPEHLDRAFFAKLRQALLQLLGAQWIFQHHGGEQFWRKEGQASELKIDRAIGDGVAELHAAVRRKANDVAGIGLVHRLPSLAHEGDNAGWPQFFCSAHDLELHARRVLARSHAHEGNAVTVIRVHVGLHFEHDTREGFVLGLHDLNHRLLVDDKRTGAWSWRGRQINQRLQHFHHTKIVDAGPKEDGGLPAGQKGLAVPVG